MPGSDQNYPGKVTIIPGVYNINIHKFLFMPKKMWRILSYQNVLPEFIKMKKKKSCSSMACFFMISG